MLLVCLARGEILIKPLSRIDVFTLCVVAHNFLLLVLILISSLYFWLD